MPTNFPALRHHRQAQIAANDAMVGLIIGIELGQKALVGHADHERLIDIHPDIPSKARLNQNVAEVGGVLADAERQMAYMSIPYAMSIYQRLIGDALELLERDGHPISGNPHQLDFPTLTRASRRHAASSCQRRRSGPSTSPVTSAIALPTIGESPVRSSGPNGWRLSSERGRTMARLFGSASRGASSQWLVPGKNSISALGSSSQSWRSPNALPTPCSSPWETLSAGVLAEIIVTDYRDRYPRRFEQVGKRQRRLRGYRRSQYPHLASVSADDLEAATATIVENGGGSA